MTERFWRAIAVLAVMTGFSVGASSQSNFDQAMELFHQRHWEEAAAAFAASEKVEPGKTNALLYQGKALVNLGKFHEAGDALRGFLVGHPKSDDALYLLAYVRFRENQPNESLQLFTAAAQLKPPTSDDFKVIALDYALLNDYSSAGRYLEEALKLDPKNVEALYHLGRVRYQQNQFDQAVAAFREVLKHDPENVKAEDNLGLSLEGVNQVDDAIMAYRRAIRLDRAALVHTEQPYLNLSILLTKLNKTADAVPLMEEAAQIAPQSAELHREMGKAYLSLDRLEDARREAEKAVDLDPKDSAAHYLLGRIYHRLGKSDLAAQHFKITEELIRLERAKMGGMGSGMVRK
jgi:tetratricopeptide (TPR) repeat protein